MAAASVELCEGVPRAPRVAERGAGAPGAGGAPPPQASGARPPTRGLSVAGGGLLGCEDCWFWHLGGCVRAEEQRPALLRTAYCTQLFRLGIREATSAYVDPDVRPPLPGGGPLHRATFLGDFAAGPKCYTLRQGGDIVVAFGGTANAADAQTDLRVRQKPVSYLPRDCKVHEGFDAQYASVRRRLGEEVQRLNPAADAERLVCCGHSLGGALATVCALDFAAREGGLRTVCVTFGSPRVGNSSFAYHFNREVDESYRFVNRRDLIPHTPSRWLYKHVRGCLVFRPDGRVSAGARMPRFAFHSLGDHSMAAYKRNFEACLHKGSQVPEPWSLRSILPTPGYLKRCVMACLSCAYCLFTPGCYFCACDHFGAPEGSLAAMSWHESPTGADDS